jgi:hypothetical protein
MNDQLASELGALTLDPLNAVRFGFHWGEGELERIRGWQAETLETVGIHLRTRRFEPLKIAVASGHGIGKSALIGMIAWWALSTCTDARVMVTANTDDQLSQKTWPEIEKWFSLAINSHWWERMATKIAARAEGHQNSWRLDRVTWSENNTEAFQGLHNLGRRIVVIYDEASSIPDKIWEVTEGALTDEGTEIIWVAFGNPTLNTGSFRECFGRFHHRWIHRHIDSRTVEGTNLELFEKWKEDWGEDSDFFRVRVRGEFPRAGSAQFISSEIVSRARKRQVGDQANAWLVLSIDVARFGDDQTVIGYRQGLKVVILERLRGSDTMQTAMRAMYYVRKLNPRTVVVDGDGIGAGVVDYMRLHLSDHIERMRDRFRLEEFHGASRPTDGDMYLNRRAEAWGLMRDWLETGSIPDEPEMESDLCGPQYLFSPRNQIQLEKKEDMKKRGLSSPDNGDMIAMTMTALTLPKTREERFREEVLAQKDPLERHFMLLAETERRQRMAQPAAWWE